jgi:hypothetical protein
MKALVKLCVIPVLVYAMQSSALSLAPEEFKASRQMACVLAQQELGQLSEDQYGKRAHTVLDGFDEAERDNILAQAVGYYGGLMFSETADNAQQVSTRLEDFVSSSTCSSDYRKATLTL